MRKNGERGGSWRVGAAIGVAIAVLAAGWLVWVGWGGAPSAATPSGERGGGRMGTLTGTERRPRPPLDAAVPAQVETATFALG